MNNLGPMCLLIVALITTVNTHAEPLKIYLDADFSNHSESAEAMYMGLSTALSEVDFMVQGRKLEIVRKDHRANSRRSLRNMQEFLRDKQALFVLGGMHSPPYIKNRDYINKNQVLLLVAWAAGGPITRYADGPNWVYRLSIDDTKAGIRLGQFALNQKQCQQPHLLLEDTPWGNSNFLTLTRFSTNETNTPWSVTWFGWNTGLNQARTKVRQIQSQGADCVIFVGNHLEGAKFVNASLSLPEPRPTFISHWGITGGDFHETIGPDRRSKIDLNFIQTCFSFMTEPRSDQATKVFARASSLFPEVLTEPQDIQSPVGFIHAYDLGKLFLAAAEDVNLKDNIKAVRSNLRDQLEKLDTPVQGLVKTYQRPFSSWSASGADAHEALGLEDICMARFDQQNHIVLHGSE